MEAVCSLKGSGAAPEYVRYNGICIATCPTGTYANASTRPSLPFSFSFNASSSHRKRRVLSLLRP